MYLKYITLSAMLAISPAAGQEAGSDLRKEFNEGLQHFSDRSRLLMESLIGELLPLLEDLDGLIDEINAYHPPQVLPNGDIIIRRKTPIEREMEKNKQDEIEL